MPEPIKIRYTPSQNCLNLIKGFESCFLEAYQGAADRQGVITIGWGTIIYPSGEKPKLGDVITQQQADDLLSWEVNQKSVSVNGMVRDIAITQSMFDALVSFAYNVGVPSLQTSTLLKKLKANPFDKTIYNYIVDKNKGYGEADSCEFLRWCRSNGNIQNGLRRRRTSEANLYALGEVNFFE